MSEEVERGRYEAEFLLEDVEKHVDHLVKIWGDSKNKLISLTKTQKQMIMRAVALYNFIIEEGGTDYKKRETLKYFIVNFPIPITEDDTDMDDGMGAAAAAAAKDRTQDNIPGLFAETDSDGDSGGDSSGGGGGAKPRAANQNRRRSLRGIRTVPAATAAKAADRRYRRQQQEPVLKIADLDLSKQEDWDKMDDIRREEEAAFNENVAHDVREQTRVWRTGILNYRAMVARGRFDSLTALRQPQQPQNKDLEAVIIDTLIKMEDHIDSFEDKLDHESFRWRFTDVATGRIMPVILLYSNQENMGRAYQILQWQISEELANFCSAEREFVYQIFTGEACPVRRRLSQNGSYAIRTGLGKRDRRQSGQGAGGAPKQHKLAAMFSNVRISGRPPLLRTPSVFSSRV